MAKTAFAYRNAIEIEPNSYELYNLLARALAKDNQLLEAAAVYRQALDAPLEKNEHDGALRGLWWVYTDKSKHDEGIAVLEELKTKMGASATLHELLGDGYKETDDSAKSEAAYAEWLTIRQKEVNQQTQRPWDYAHLARQLLDKDIMPEKALELAERGSQIGGSWYDFSTTARAYLANGRYEEALEQFKRRMNSMTHPGMSAADATRQLWSQVAHAGRNAKDEEQFLTIVEKLKRAGLNTPTVQLHANLALAQYYRYHEQPEKVLDYMSRTGFIAESAWSVTGPLTISRESATM